MPNVRFFFFFFFTLMTVTKPILLDHENKMQKFVVQAFVVFDISDTNQMYTTRESIKSAFEAHPLL